MSGKPIRLEPRSEYDQFIIGLDENNVFFIYDKDRIIDYLAGVISLCEEVGIKTQEDAYEAALEYYEFNIKALRLGCHTPVFVTKEHDYDISVPEIH